LELIEELSRLAPNILLTNVHRLQDVLEVSLFLIFSSFLLISAFSNYFYLQIEDATTRLEYIEMMGRIFSDEKNDMAATSPEVC
jgi:hypothetical protein